MKRRLRVATLGLALGLVLICLPAGRLALACEAPVAAPRRVFLEFNASAGGKVAMTLTPSSVGSVVAHDSASGRTLWEFTPPERPPDPTAVGTLSELAVLRFDAALDGAIHSAAGDRVWVFFGLRRGGRFLYALDVTSRDTPRLLWKVGPDDLPGIGETWSTPTIARVHVAGEPQNDERVVLIIGGGFEGVIPGSGRRVYLLDAASGRLLWSAGPSGAEPSPDLPMPRMTASLPGRVTAVDTSGDGLADRLYAADLAGQLWRFDLANGERRTHFAAGGVIASLGGAASSSTEDARAFFNGPDVALIRRRGGTSYYNISVGSGDRVQPFASSVHDRFYAIRDVLVHGRLDQAAFDALAPHDDASLFDITDRHADMRVPGSANGWRLELRLHGGWAGEKVLAESVTAAGTVLFTTFQPQSAVDCAAGGIHRVYAVSLEQGGSTLDLDGDGAVTGEDLVVELDSSASVGPVEVVLPREGAAERNAVCSVAGERLRDCVGVETLRRSYWQRVTPD